MPPTRPSSKIQPFPLIFEIEGHANTRSIPPKNAGFTGTRCALTVVPKGLMGTSASGEQVSLGLWNRRQSKFRRELHRSAWC